MSLKNQVELRERAPGLKPGDLSRVMRDEDGDSTPDHQPRPGIAPLCERGQIAPDCTRCARDWALGTVECRTDDGLPAARAATLGERVPQ
jgi:hypothetical protein